MSKICLSQWIIQHLILFITIIVQVSDFPSTFSSLLPLFEIYTFRSTCRKFCKDIKEENIYQSKKD